jgi:hypothetical protein
MRRRLAAAAAVFAAFVFLHLPIEDVFDWMAGRFGFDTYDRVAFWTFLIGGVVLLVTAWSWPSRRRVLIGSSMTMLLVLMAVAQRLLVVVSIENIHYPQYALLLWALARALPSIESAWLATVGLGIVDEGYQFVAQTRGTPDYFDWNDVVLNAIGASLGVVVTLALTTAIPRVRLPARIAVVMAAALIALALVLDPPVLSPFFSFTPGGRAFHKVSATEAAVVVAALWAGVRASVSAPNLPAA